MIGKLSDKTSHQQNFGGSKQGKKNDGSETAAALIKEKLSLVHDSVPDLIELINNSHWALEHQICVQISETDSILLCRREGALIKRIDIPELRNLYHQTKSAELYSNAPAQMRRVLY